MLGQAGRLSAVGAAVIVAGEDKRRNAHAPFKRTFPFIFPRRVNLSSQLRTKLRENGAQRSQFGDRYAKRIRACRPPPQYALQNWRESSWV
jgi:hypothetical protein